MRILPKRDQIVQRHDLSFGLGVLCFVFLTYVYAKILRRIRPLALRRSDLSIWLLLIRNSRDAGYVQ
jgi:hypothetical protein